MRIVLPQPFLTLYAHYHIVLLAPCPCLLKFAYGQTGSGKTYTMDGHAYTGDSTTSTSEQGGRSQPRALLNSSDEDQLGLVPRCLSSLFDLIEERTQGAQGNASGGGEDMEFSPDMTVRVSFLQVNHRYTAYRSYFSFGPTWSCYRTDGACTRALLSARPLRLSRHAPLSLSSLLCFRYHSSSSINNIASHLSIDCL